VQHDGPGGDRCRRQRSERSIELSVAHCDQHTGRGA
jgi:hypothetical protein